MEFYRALAPKEHQKWQKIKCDNLLKYTLIQIPQNQIKHNR